MLDFFLFCWGGGRTHTTSQQDPILLLLPPSALLPLDGWGHRGRVKVTSGRRGVGLGLSEGGGGGRGRGGCIKTDRTQVVLYPPCPALGKRKPLKCSGSTSYFFFLSPPPPPTFTLLFTQARQNVCTLRTRHGSIIREKNHGQALQNVGFRSAPRRLALKW